MTSRSLSLSLCVCVCYEGDEGSVCRMMVDRVISSGVCVLENRSERDGVERVLEDDRNDVSRSVCVCVCVCYEGDEG